MAARRRKARLRRVLLVSAGLLLLLAVGLWLGLYLEGVVAQHSAQQLLVQYQQSIDSNTPPQGEAGAAGSDHPAQTTADPAPQYIDGYQIIGILTLERTAQTMPVISETNDDALKVSVCWFAGAFPGETGNMVITGHNYASGAHFGRLDKLTVGDRVTMTVPNATYDYEVYATEIIQPDQPEKLNEVAGDTELTLLTCTSHGNRRLVVRCKPVA